MSILEVGSGKRFLNKKNVIHFDLDKKLNHIEVNGSTYNLPFNDSSFNLVYCSHILEHLEQPTKAIKELKRVSKNIVVIKVPNASYFKFKTSDINNGHISSWNRYTLKCLLSNHFKKVEISLTKRYFKESFISRFIHYIVCMILSKNEITAICHKR